MRSEKLCECFHSIEHHGWNDDDAASYPLATMGPEEIADWGTRCRRCVTHYADRCRGFTPYRPLQYYWKYYWNRLFPRDPDPTTKGAWIGTGFMVGLWFIGAVTLGPMVGWTGALIFFVIMVIFQLVILVAYLG